MLANKASFLKGIIGDQVIRLAQQVRHSAPLLVVAAEQEEDLRLESIPLPVSIEVREEGVLLKDFQEKPARKAGCNKRARVVLPTPITPSIAIYISDGCHPGKAINNEKL